MTTPIDQKVLDFLQGYCSEIVYERDEIIIYEGHVPRVGFVLLEGKLEIIMSKSKKEVTPNNAIGVRELAKNQPYKYTVKIYPNTKVLPLDRSTLLSLCEVDDENIRDFANELLLIA